MITSPVDRSDVLVEPPYSMPDAMPFEPPIGQPSGPPDAAGAVEPDAPAAPTERSRARWERPALAGLLVATAVLYIWGLGASGWANSFYSAAAQAGSQSWKAFFFGSFDASSAITVDKPPASLWIMGLSVRIFGLSTWSLLVPQALMGVGTVAVVYASVRRKFSAQAALLAGLVMATTPVAALMFRFNNPDALLVLLMTGAAYCVLRGVEDGRRRWIVWTGVLIGFGFLTKQLQVLLVVPPLALAYLVAAPHRLKRRIVDLLIGGGAMIAASGWWIAIVSLIPANMRPYIGGSQDNSILELTLGYNGFGRLTGDETGSVGGGGNWGATGITRLFDGAMGGQIAWLIPFALLAVGVGLWLTRREPRTDATRAAVIVWGGWLVVTALVFSFMQGIFHEYYTVALAPAVAAMVGIGGHLLWARRHSVAARGVLAGGVAVTVLWSAVLLGRAADWNPWLRTAVVVLGFAAAIAIVAGPRLTAKASAAAAIAAIVASLAGPTAWAIETASTPHTGSIVIAGPTVTTSNGGGFGGRGGGTRPGGGNGGGAPNGGFDGGGTAPTTGGGMGGGAAGGLLDSSTPSDEIVEMLQADSGDYTWVAAAIGSNRAAGFQLASEQPVMAIGGFNGSDPSPTLEQFQAYVADGRIHYYIEGGSFGQSMGGSDEAQSIAAWVEANFTPVTVDGVTLYDLTA